MKSKLALSTAVALSALVGCGAPIREPSSTGGNTSTGGDSASGGNGAGGTGGGNTSPNSGGTTGSGGTKTTTATSAGGSGGGAGPAGGAAAGGSNAAGGGTASGGSNSSGGTTGAGGTTATAGTSGSGGSAGSGGTTLPANPQPCDIYAAANTPCVAAHSTVRALYADFAGALYQVKRASDKTTKDIPVSGPGGFVDISVQDTFCTGTTCTIPILYDQSPKKNHLTKAPVATWLKSGANDADASKGQITVSGHVAHGIWVQNGNNSATDVGYRNNATQGLAKGDEPEAMYMVIDGTRWSSICCFDYGNVGTSGTDEGNATMEAMYWGNSSQWGKGGGPGPWVGADLENGMFEGDSTSNPNYATVTGWTYVTGMLKGPSGNSMALKVANAQSGALDTRWDGKRPPGYSPMKKVGAIILGLGGDGSSFGVGTFFEGAITSGNPPNSTDDAIQANIVAAHYGK